MVIRARLPATALRHYLRPSIDRQVSGRVLTAPVRRETLIPAELVLASSRHGDLVELPVQVDPGDMAQGLRLGDSVRVLAAYTEGARRGRAVVLLPSAEVVQVFQDPAGLTGAGRIAASSSACRATVPRSWPPPSPPRGSSWSRPAVPPATMAPPRRGRRVAPAPGARDRRLAAGHPADGRLRAGRLGPGRLGAGRLGAGRLAARYLDAGSRCPRPRRVPSRRRPADPDLLLRRRRHPADRYPTSDQVDAVTRVVMT